MARRDKDLAPPLPHNLEAERSVLGAILLDNAALQLAAPTLFPGDFFLEQHKQTYAALVGMHEAGVAMDLVTLTDWLHSKGKLEQAGGAAYLAQLLDGVPHVGHIEHYATIVKRTARLRSIIHAAHATQLAAFDTGADPDEINERVRGWSTASPARAATNGNGNGNGHLGMMLADFLAATFPDIEHLIKGLVPRGGSVLVVALPHRMKSWLTTGIALGASVAGTALGSLEVPRPVRTMLVQVEDPEQVVQWRIRQLMRSAQFAGTGCVPENVWVVPRRDFGKFDDEWFTRLLTQVKEFNADLVILDVLRRLFVGRGDLNSPKDSADFLELIDRLRDETGCAVMLVHHENKKEAEIMAAAAGSYNFAGWANVVIQIKRKKEEQGITHVEIEADNKLAESPEPMRMVLDLASPAMPLRMEALEGGDSDFRDAMEQLTGDWTVRDIMEALGVPRSNAHRRVRRWLKDGKIEKVTAGKRGRTGGLARYRAVEEESDYLPVHIRTVQ